MNLRLAVRVKSKIILVDPADIESVEAAGNYVRIHVASAGYLVRVTMAEFERGMSEEGFVRIHRSTIVNLAHVASLEPQATGDYVVHLRSGRDVFLSRTFRERFFAMTTIGGSRRSLAARVTAVERDAPGLPAVV